MIFVDTSFWVALFLPRDPHHAEARALFEDHARSRLASTNHVTGETWTYLRRKAGHTQAVSFLDSLELTPAVTVVHVDASTEQAAHIWLRKHDEREYSFVDATSFAVMTGQGMTEALAFDGDFSAAGFVELRP